MTIQELHRLVLTLSNGSHCRFWIHWNYPKNPTMMAVQCQDFRKTSEGHHALSPVEVEGIEKLGFKVENRESLIYTINRTNEDGSYFTSEL